MLFSLWDFPSGSVIKNPLAMPETQETRVWSLYQEDLLGKEIATHSSIPAWKIPWTKQASRLQSVGPQRVKLDWSDLALSTSPSLYCKDKFWGIFSESPKSQDFWEMLKHSNHIETWYLRKSLCHEKLTNIIINYKIKLVWFWIKTTRFWFLKSCNLLECLLIQRIQPNESFLHVTNER